MNVEARGSRQVPHTADVALEVWVEDEAALLAEAARAMIDILTEGASVEARDERAVAVDAYDPQDRLVRWLNEVLYLAVTEGFLTADAEVDLDGDGDGSRLRARLRGEADAAGRIRTELKSATYHDLSLAAGPEGARARVVLDV